LAVAAVLAVFLLYTAVAGNSTPTLTPNQVPGHAGKLAVVGTVVGQLSGDSHTQHGLRFGLKNIDGKPGFVPVVYHGDNPPPLFKVGRSVVVTGSYAGGRLAATNILTKCPSKYTATTAQTPAN
jgi:cytochrome c-type biogenesis protein CcmE